MIFALNLVTPANQAAFLPLSMASPHTVEDTFAQATQLMDQHGDTGARDLLAEWQRQCSALPTYHPRQDYLLSKVEQLMASLLRQSPEDH